MRKLTILFVIILANPAIADGFKKGDDSYYEFEQGKYKLFASKSDSGFLYTNQNMESVVEVLDTDKDGVVDLLRYTVYAKDGTDFITSEDYGMDGDINMRWHHAKDDYMEVWYLEKWNRILGMKEELHIVNGEWRIPVVNTNGRFVVQTHNKTLNQTPNSGAG